MSLVTKLSTAFTPRLAATTTIPPPPSRPIIDSPNLERRMGRPEAEILPEVEQIRKSYAAQSNTDKAENVGRNADLCLLNFTRNQIRIIHRQIVRMRVKCATEFGPPPEAAGPLTSTPKEEPRVLRHIMKSSPTNIAPSKNCPFSFPFCRGGNGKEDAASSTSTLKLTMSNSNSKDALFSSETKRRLITVAILLSVILLFAILITQYSSPATVTTREEYRDDDDCADFEWGPSL
ncbi:uncharacterized protein LOC118435247 [Folsomia candida]|uniref:Uncharacterized protein n=1 Tax=Folsomia candida TaxID=158441 RepID=A0A226EGD7_FOLCA|nr:uncharacterized protein LOC118435247 [Folsomia candida]OXA55841.1 hypothetical protein Fcan01_08776 [Folsomia candida]